MVKMDTKRISGIIKQDLTPAKIFLFITLSLVIFVRLRLLSMPLDRDEGGWAYAGWLILNGNAPFTYFYDTKMPVIYYIYAIITMLFGQTIEGVRTGIFFIIIINMLLVYNLFKRISEDNDKCFLASAFYGLLSLDSGTLSLSGYSTHFVLTFIMLFLIFSLEAIKQNNRIMLFVGGIFTGLAFLVKQPSFFFFLFFLLYLFIINLINNKQKKEIFVDILIYVAGLILIFFIVCLIMKLYGVFERFWFMTFDYAMKYGSAISPQATYSYFSLFLRITSIFFKSVFILFIIKVLVLFFFYKNLQKKLLHLFLFFSAIGFSISGFYFYPHYFIIFSLPISLILAEDFSDSESEKIIISEKINNFVYVFTIILLLFSQYEILFKLNPIKVSRKIFMQNPFPESIEIAQFIKNNTNQDDKIAIMGSEPQILFYAKRKSATGYVYFNQLMDPNEIADKMQIEAIQEIEEASPKYFIYVNIITSWAMNTKSSERIYNWFKNKFNNKQIELVGIINIISPDKTEYVWGREAEKYKLVTPYWIAVLKAKK